MPAGTARIIVRKGIYKFTESERKARSLNLICNVTQLPTNEYLNLKYNEPKRYFGHYQLVYAGAVIQAAPLEFTTQLILHYEAIENQLLQSTHCLALNLNFNMHKFYQGQRSGCCPNAPDYQIEEIINPTLLLMPYDEVWFSLYNNTTLQVQAFYEEINNLCGEANSPTFAEPSGSKPTPPNKPASPNPAVPGEQYPDKPYDDDSNDGGRSYDPPGNSYPGFWRETVSYSNGTTTQSPLGDTNPYSVWTAGAQCWGDPDPGPQNKPSGLKVYRNGEYQYCAINQSRGTVTSWVAEYVLGG